MWVQAVAQPNIALIKYWGKRDRARNLPATGSLSLTLDTLWTRMSVEFRASSGADTLLVNGARSASMLPRVSSCLDRIAGTPRPPAAVSSESNFPIAAGLASSSSAFAALTLAASRARGLPQDDASLVRFAGAASGSAARSICGGIVELQVDDHAIDVRCIAAAGVWPLKVVVAITDEGEKPLASGEAMNRSAATSPFYRSWVEHQDADLTTARQAVENKDFEKLAAVAEHNCLKMHSVMWSSKPAIVYWKEATVNCMETVRELQRRGMAVFFTIDAGPQVKAVCLPEAGEAVAAALSQTPGVTRVLVSGLGKGARLLPAGTGSPAPVS
ncbi:MAG: diphosphomevalonate decarboxylase [Woeseia sp.]